MPQPPFIKHPLFHPGYEVSDSVRLFHEHVDAALSGHHTYLARALVLAKRVDPNPGKINRWREGAQKFLFENPPTRDPRFAVWKFQVSQVGPLLSGPALDFSDREKLRRGPLDEDIRKLAYRWSKHGGKSQKHDVFLRHELLEPLRIEVGTGEDREGDNEGRSEVMTARVTLASVLCTLHKQNEEAGGRPYSNWRLASTHPEELGAEKYTLAAYDIPKLGKERAAGVTVRVCVPYVKNWKDDDVLARQVRAIWEYYAERGLPFQVWAPEFELPRQAQKEAAKKTSKL